MSINTQGLPAYTEQITKKIDGNRIINDLKFIDKVKKDKAAKVIKAVANKNQK